MKRFLLLAASAALAGCGEVERVEPEPPPAPPVAPEPPRGEWMRNRDSALDPKLPNDAGRAPVTTSEKRGDWMWQKGKLDRQEPPK